MQLARALKRNPRQLAQLLVSELPHSSLLEQAEVAGAGFINFRLSAAAKLAVVGEVLGKGSAFGRSSSGGRRKVLVEFVSANPTGPLHVGHGAWRRLRRQPVQPACQRRLGCDREYYVNDAGRQMDILALSTWLRYLELRGHGEAVTFPPNAYQGDYVRDMASQMKAAHGDQIRAAALGRLAGTPGLPDAERADDEAKATARGAPRCADRQRQGLLGEDWHYVHNLRAHRTAGRLPQRSRRVRRAFRRLVLRKIAVRHRPGRALRRTARKGRPPLRAGRRQVVQVDRLRRREGSRRTARQRALYTYFASDIAYHLNKYERGFERVINIWGADHHGYIPRVKGAISALGLDPDG
jgi:arginyl-tRNA synthetase